MEKTASVINKVSEMFDDINKIIENNITDTDLVNFCA